MYRGLLVMVVACATPQSLGPVGSTVRLRGTISDTPHQHLEQHVPGKQIAYFDYAPDRQAVLYWATAVACPGTLLVTGTVIAVTGASKGGDGEVTERSIDVATAECLP
ncbi:MAG: hypothetical protein ABI867_26760 [Kofleriaceae bacterium]